MPCGQRRSEGESLFRRSRGARLSDRPSFAAGLFVDPAPGPVLANYVIDNMRFLTPVYVGDTLQVRTCKEINPRLNADHGEVRWDCQVTNQNGAVVAQYDVLTMVAKTWPVA
jgi:oxepin-CoA hydrolase/3-oxo-5,6-dehydrosuberyl-CoA semialdehyde dehydrogenase